ncbi:MAG TPA: exonuclease SbcCD subunit D [Solirubrobacteraceae bacterium]|jgi:DNA repair exonuclease SbcCD nuclease subunit
MRIVHIADTHLGFRQLHRVNDAGRNVREQDVYDAFERAIELIVELRPAAVVHAGDLFDSYHPSTAAINVALDGFQRLREAGIPVVVIAGNHSTPRVVAAEHIFELLRRFGSVHVVHGGSQVIDLGELAVHGVAHNNDAKAMGETIRAARPSAEHRFNVLVAHTGLDRIKALVGSESGSVILPGSVLAEALAFDYVALGHYHTFHGAGQNGAWAGSLERLSWADDAEKGVVEVDLAADCMSADFLTLHPIAWRPQIRLDTINAATLGDGDLTAEIIARADGHELDGAMVALRIINVTAAQWSAIDRNRIDDAFRACLHFEYAPDLVGGPDMTGAPPALREFLLDWPGLRDKRLNSDDFIARAESCLAQADEELAAR